MKGNSNENITLFIRGDGFENVSHFVLASTRQLSSDVLIAHLYAGSISYCLYNAGPVDITQFGSKNLIDKASGDYWGHNRPIPSINSPLHGRDGDDSHGNFKRPFLTFRED